MAVASVEAVRDNAGPSPVKAARRRLDDVMDDVARLKGYRWSRNASRGQLALRFQAAAQARSAFAVGR
jgi:hypothetical protein